MKRRILQILLWITLLAMILSACGPAATDGTESGTSSTVITITSGETDGSATDTPLPSTDGGTEGSDTQQTQPSTETTDGSSDTGTVTSTDGSSDTGAVTSTDGNTGSVTETDRPTDTATDKNTDTGSGTQDTGGTDEPPEEKPWEQDPPEQVRIYGTAPLTPLPETEAYGYQWLDTLPQKDLLKKAYRNLVDGVSRMEANITFDQPIPADLVNTLWYCYRDDYPEHFWVEDAFSYNKLRNDAVSILPNYNMTKTQKNTAQTGMDAAVAEVLQGLSGNMTPYERELALHHRLVFRCDYVDGTFAHTAYGALVEKKAVCDGYARAFAILCKKAGIPCLIARGYSNNPETGKQEGHAWNVVKLDGEYYHVDVTWDDAGNPENGDKIHVVWLNLTTERILRDHKIKQQGYAIPTCTATKYFYLQRNDMIVDSLTVDGLLNRTYRSGAIYVCKVLAEDPGDVEGWIRKNATDMMKRMGLRGISLSTLITGNEITLLITPK